MFFRWLARCHAGELGKGPPTVFMCVCVCVCVCARAGEIERERGLEDGGEPLPSARASSSSRIASRHRRKVATRPTSSSTSQATRHYECDVCAYFCSAHTAHHTTSMHDFTFIV